MGWRRTTLTEVARRAGVSRMTIYRAWPDMPALLADLMTREWGDLIATQPQDDATVTPTLLADGIVAMVGSLRENELFSRIIEVDPELILPYLFDRRGRSQELILGALSTAIEIGQQAGAIRSGSPVAIARGLLLAAHGFALSGHTMVDDRLDQEALDAELHMLIERSVRP